VARAAETDDQQLVARANAGEEAAFEELYRRHRDYVGALAFRFLRDREEALEVLQETFAYLFERFPGFELTSSLRTFLYPVVKHRCLDRIRRRRPSVDIATVEESLAIVPSAAGRADAELVRALEALPAVQREVIVLRFVEDLSLEQIASATEAPLGTVKSRLHHALLELRRRLG